MIVLTVFVGCTRQLTEKNETSSENLQSIFDHEELKIHIVQDGGWDTDFTTVFNPKNQITTINILVKGSFDSLERHDYVGTLTKLMKKYLSGFKFLDTQEENGPCYNPDCVRIMLFPLKNWTSYAAFLKL